MAPGDTYIGELSCLQALAGGPPDIVEGPADLVLVRAPSPLPVPGSPLPLGGPGA